MAAGSGVLGALGRKSRRNVFVIIRVSCRHRERVVVVVLARRATHLNKLLVVQVAVWLWPVVLLKLAREIAVPLVRFVEHLSLLLQAIGYRFVLAQRLAVVGHWRISQSYR